jgi:predicted lysophospholipase L1 biosynthesis ABC-type transport system permease subunit
MIIGNLIGLILVNILFQAPALWYAGRRVLGIEKVEFITAMIITALYTVINTILIGLMTSDVAGFFQIIAYLYVVKRYFETTWKNAVIVTLVMVFINIVIAFLLAGPGFFLYHR